MCDWYVFPIGSYREMANRYVVHFCKDTELFCWVSSVSYWFHTEKGPIDMGFTSVCRLESCCSVPRREASWVKNTRHISKGTRRGDTARQMAQYILVPAVKNKAITHRIVLMWGDLGCVCACVRPCAYVFVNGFCVCTVCERVYSTPAWLCKWNFVWTLRSVHPLARVEPAYEYQFLLSMNINLLLPSLLRC